MKELAIIGTGRWGKRYIETISKMDSCSLKYTVTRDYKSVDNVDGVIIATPPETHYEILKHFKCPVLCEKPLVNTIEGLRIEGRIMTGFTFLYNRNLLAWKSKDVNLVRTVFGNTEPYSKSSSLWEMGIHGIAISIFLLGYPKKIDVTEEFQNFKVLMEHENGSSIIEYGYNFSDKTRKVFVNEEEVDISSQQPRELELQIADFLDFIDGKEVIPNLQFSKSVSEIALIIENLCKKRKVQ
jgi:hypothetical protein